MDKTSLAVALPLWFILIVLPGVGECGVSSNTWTVAWTLALAIGGSVLVERSAKRPVTWPQRSERRTRYAVEFDTAEVVWDEN